MPARKPPAPTVMPWALCAMAGVALVELIILVLGAVLLAIPCLMYIGFEQLGLGWNDAGGFFRIVLMTIIGMGGIGALAGVPISLWRLMPRRLSGSPPGVRLWPDDQPGLWDEIRQSALAVGSPPPDELYLTLDMTVGYSRAGGALGFGGRRLFGVGIGALGTLTRAEFRALSASGLAHLNAPERVANSWSISALAGMARSMAPLGRPQVAGPILFVTGYSMPFQHLMRTAAPFCARLLASIWQFASARMDARADSLACSIAGTRPVVTALRTWTRYQPFAAPFWHIEAAPLVQAGFLPPLAEGFARFLQTPQVDQASDHHLAHEMNRRALTVDNLLPLLHDRIAAMPQIDVPAAFDGPATELLDRVDQLERRLAASHVPGCLPDNLQRISWDNAGPLLYIPSWRYLTSANADLLAGRLVADLVDMATDRSLTRRVRNPPGMTLDDNQRIRHFGEVLQAALCLCLVRQDWRMSSRPGEFVFSKADQSICPAVEQAAIAASAIDSDDWRDKCLSWGLSDSPLVGD